MNPLATLKTSRVVIAPNSRSAPPAEETGLDFRGGPQSSCGVVAHGEQAIKPDRLARPASPSHATGKTQPLDRIRPLSLLLETLGWIAVLGLAFWIVAMIAYAVEVMR